MKKNKREKKENKFREVCGLQIEIPYVSKEDQKRADTLNEYLDILRGKKSSIRFRLTGVVKEIKPVVIVEPIPSPPGNPSHRMFFCSVNSKEWSKYEQKCKDFQLKLSPMKLPEYVSIYTAHKISRTQNRLIKAGIIISAIALIFILYGTEIKNFFENLIRRIF